MTTQPTRFALARAMLRRGCSLRETAAKIGTTAQVLDMALWDYLSRLPTEPYLRGGA